jgi:hypothetical protein
MMNEDEDACKRRRAAGHGALRKPSAGAGTYVRGYFEKGYAAANNRHHEDTQAAGPFSNVLRVFVPVWSHGLLHLPR